MDMILGDIHFRIRAATINGYMLDPDWLGKYGKNENPGLCWEVVVQTEEQLVFKDTDDENIVSPRISWGEFSFPAVRRWTELAGETINSDMVKRSESVPAKAFSYFDTHEPIPYSTLKFIKRAGNKFVIQWEGACDPLWSEPYRRDVPFLIQTEAVFKEITVQASRRDTDATTRERLSQYLEPDDFIQHPMKEVVQNIRVENRFGIFDPLLRRVFGYPDIEPFVRRYSVFEPRL